jgi:hypothetical protein
MPGGRSGKTYVLEDNAAAWQSFSLDFPGQEAKITLNIGDDSQELSVGLDDVFRISQVDQLGPISGPIASKGSWQDEDTFLLDMQVLDGTHYELGFDFVEGGVDVSLKDIIVGGWYPIRGTLEGR